MKNDSYSALFVKPVLIFVFQFQEVYISNLSTRNILDYIIYKKYIRLYMLLYQSCPFINTGLFGKNTSLTIILTPINKFLPGDNDYSNGGKYCIYSTNLYIPSLCCCCSLRSVHHIPCKNHVCIIIYIKSWVTSVYDFNLSSSFFEFLIL